MTRTPACWGGGEPARRPGLRGGPVNAPTSGARWVTLPGLMLALTFVTGVVDAVGYLRLDQVFAGNMTGNVVILGMAAAGGSRLPVLGPALALVSFLRRGPGRAGAARRRAARLEQPVHGPAGRWCGGPGRVRGRPDRRNGRSRHACGRGLGARPGHGRAGGDGPSPRGEGRHHGGGHLHSPPSRRTPGWARPAPGVAAAAVRRRLDRPRRGRRRAAVPGGRRARRGAGGGRRRGRDLLGPLTARAGSTTPASVRPRPLRGPVALLLGGRPGGHGSRSSVAKPAAPRQAPRRTPASRSPGRRLLRTAGRPPARQQRTGRP